MGDLGSTTRTRRDFLGTSLAVPAALVLVACDQKAVDSATAESVDQGKTLEPTPACGGEEGITPPLTEGPFYTPDSPERKSLLEPEIKGEKITVSGQVLSTDCQPIAGALVDFWHADGRGVYDNAGYKLRGHQFTDKNGRYTLETVVPGLYPGRTRHFHVKVQAPGKPVLTTQLFFPGEPQNATDSIFRPELVVAVEEAGEGKAAAFTFVLKIG